MKVFLVAFVFLSSFLLLIQLWIIIYSYYGSIIGLLPLILWMCIIFAIVNKE